MRRRLRPGGALRAAALLGAALLAAPAGAAQCSVQASAVDFGVYDPFALTPTDSVGTITVQCSGFTGESIAYRISIGTGSSGVFAPRTMTDGTTWRLTYNLYTGASRTLIWGDGTGSSRAVSDGYALPGRGISRSYPVYGRIPGRQNVAPGAYADTLVITLDY